MILPLASWAAVTPYPPYPGAVPSVAYKVAVDGQPVFVHNFLTYDQFNWMDRTRQLVQIVCFAIRFPNDLATVWVPG
jgi:hypothetical protein